VITIITDGEIILATDALEFPRTAANTMRFAHRLRVFLRAVRIARTARTMKRHRQLADRDERALTGAGVSRHRDGGDHKLAELMLMLNQTNN
jgi:hypothetical protein